MANRSASKPIDVQQLLTGVAMLELKALGAGVEYWQTWMNQAAKLSDIAGDTLKAIDEDKGSVSDAARRLTQFGKDNADVFGKLQSRLGQLYFEEIGRFAESVEAKPKKHAAAQKPARRKSSSRKRPARSKR